MPPSLMVMELIIVAIDSTENMVNLILGRADPGVRFSSSILYPLPTYRGCMHAHSVWG
jgi:hypothetical protein